MFATTVRIRLTIASIVLLLSSAAGAQQSPEAEFYASYTRALATVRPALMAEHPTPEQARIVATLPQIERDLEAMVRRLVGPVPTPKGFTGTGKWNGDWNLVAFEKGVSGIGFSQGEPMWDHPYVVVSTMGLLRQWPSLSPELRNDPEAIFRNGLMSATVVLFNAGRSLTVGFLPIVAPPGVDVALASVDITSNGGTGIWPPQSISIYLRRGDRIYIAFVPPALKFSPAVSCGVDIGAALRVIGDEAERVLPPLARKCWEGGGKDVPAAIAATQQAQKFIDDLAQR